MALTTLKVTVPETEYSRYFAPLSNIVATILPAGAVGGEVVTVTLERQERGATNLAYGPVATKTLTLTGNTKHTVTFNLNADCFDATNLYRAVQGFYTVKAVSSSITGESDQFAISLVPAKEIKAQYLTGISLRLSYLTMPLQQPKNITGVTIGIPGDSHNRGVFTLTYANTAKTLSWDGGPAVVVDANSTNEYMLLNAQQADYIPVVVDGTSLPTADKSDTIILDRPQLTDDQIRQHTWQACSAIQGELRAFLEPRTIDTEAKDDAYCDFLGDAAPFFRSHDPLNWLGIKMPHRPLLNVQALRSYIGPDRRVFDFDPAQWLVWTEQQGFVRFVPGTAAKIATLVSTGGLVLPYSAYNSVPDYWHYRIDAGLRDMLGKRTAVRDAIAKQAAIYVLREVGVAATGPYSAVSVQKDGMSENLNYAGSGANAYAGKIKDLQDWLDKNIKQIRRRIMGFEMHML